MTELIQMNRNLRKKPRISYYEPEEPNLDEYIFCDDCSDIVYEYCGIHGPLLVVPDDKAGLGIFTTLTLPKGVRFGPYVGLTTEDPKSMYSWQIRDENNKPSHLIDASDANSSNWMRYVNCSRHFAEQNLVAYQYWGQIYYRTIKIIPKFTEMLVFYGREFAKTLKIDLKIYNTDMFNILYACYSQEKHKETKKNVFNLNKDFIKKQNKKTFITPKKVINQNKETTPKTEVLKLDSAKDSVENKCNSNTSENNHTNIKEQNNNCDVANSKTDNQENLNQHLVHEMKTLKCSEVLRSFTKKQDLINKAKVKSNISTKIDDSLNMYLSDRTLNANEVKLIFNCRKNHFEEEKNTSETPFIRIQTGDKHFSCDICLKKFSHKCNLNEHIRTHTGEKPFSCDICFRKFSHKSYLNKHIRTHTGEKPFSCDICFRKFSRKDVLNHHLRTHTGEKPFSCDICFRKFSYKNVLIDHLRTHTGEKPFSCDICFRKFSYKNVLIDHLRTHTGEKPFSCDICFRKFSQLAHLNRHLRTHTGEKPFSCDICFRKFSQLTHLNGHLRTHTGEKPFSCDICFRKFSQLAHLNGHLRTHTGEKPFSCDICFRKFSRKDVLNDHLRTHTGEKPFGCDICFRKFSHKRNLNTHLRIHTSEKPR